MGDSCESRHETLRGYSVIQTKIKQWREGGNTYKRKINSLHNYINTQKSNKYADDIIL